MTTMAIKFTAVKDFNLYEGNNLTATSSIYLNLSGLLNTFDVVGLFLLTTW